MPERTPAGEPEQAAVPAVASAPATARFPDVLARSAGLGFGNAANARAVAALLARDPAPEDPEAAERIAFFEGERRRLRGEGAGLAVGYAKKLDEALEHAQVDFSALELARQHGPVARVDTDLTAEEVAAGLKGAWKKVFGTEIPANALALLIGKWKAEGGTKKGGVHNYNFGNIQIQDKKKAAYDWQDMRAPEHTGPGGTPQQKTSPFAAFKSVEQAAMGLIHFLIGSDKKGPRRAILGVLMFAPEGDAGVRHYCLVGFAKNYFNVDPLPIRYKGAPARTNYFDLMRGNVPKGKDLDTLMNPPVPKPVDPPPDYGPVDEPPDEPDADSGPPPPEPPPADSGGGGEGGAGGGGSRDDGTGGAEGSGPA